MNLESLRKSKVQIHDDRLILDGLWYAVILSPENVDTQLSTR